MEHLKSMTQNLDACLDLLAATLGEAANKPDPLTLKSNIAKHINQFLESAKKLELLLVEAETAPVSLQQEVRDLKQELVQKKALFQSLEKKVAEWTETFEALRRSQQALVQDLS